MKKFRKAWNGITITSSPGDDISAYDVPYGYCCCCCSCCGCGCCFLWPWICG